MRLLDLSPGQAASIAVVEGEGAFRRRLLELGLLPGVTVQLGPLGAQGDPVTLRVRGTNLSLRRADAAKLVVETPR